MVAMALLLAACGGGDDDATTTTTTAEAPTSTETTAVPAPPVPDLDAVELTLTEIGQFDQPTTMTWCGEVAYVAEKGGTVRRFDDREVVLDLPVSSGNEQGLLGIACDPADGTFYASYTDRGGDSMLVQLQIDGPSDLAPATLLRTEQPAPNHNGGHIIFGPDGLLWYGLGDGGGANDQFDNAQDPGERLGSIVRLNPVSPTPEIVLKGVRNPWRFSFDRETGDLWIGDVGQGQREEIDLLPAGAIDGRNLGWPAFEGTRRHRDDVAPPPDAVPPVLEYGRADGQSVVGGYVYRGSEIPALRGAYLFTDTYAPVLRAFHVSGAERRFGEVPGGLVSSFAEGPDGELYVLSLEGGIYRIAAG